MNNKTIKIKKEYGLILANLYLPCVRRRKLCCLGRGSPLVPYVADRGECRKELGKPGLAGHKGPPCGNTPGAAAPTAQLLSFAHWKSLALGKPGEWV
jgi:hypothetical protein